MVWTSAYRSDLHSEPFCKPQNCFREAPNNGAHRDAVWVFFEKGSADRIGDDGLSWASQWTLQSTSLVILRRLLTVRTEWSKK